ncbi:MAG: hypothetical protein GOU99_00650 [Candidatus Altiarchaeota archaeon]|nr:hypothetical protein [Candidatus Altiarchaeota archaeon]
MKIYSIEDVQLVELDERKFGSADSNIVRALHFSTRVGDGLVLCSMNSWGALEIDAAKELFDGIELEKLDRIYVPDIRPSEGMASMFIHGMDLLKLVFGFLILHRLEAVLLMPLALVLMGLNRLALKNARKLPAPDRYDEVNLPNSYGTIILPKMDSHRYSRSLLKYSLIGDYMLFTSFLALSLFSWIGPLSMIGLFEFLVVMAAGTAMKYLLGTYLERGFMFRLLESSMLRETIDSVFQDWLEDGGTDKIRKAALIRGEGITSAFSAKLSRKLLSELKKSRIFLHGLNLVSLKNMRTNELIRT